MRNAKSLYKHNVSYEAFKALSGGNSLKMWKNGREVDACVTSWALWGPKDDSIMSPFNKKRKFDNSWYVYAKSLGIADPYRITREEYETCKDPATGKPLSETLLSNVAFIALNASNPAHGEEYSPNEFFHTQRGDTTLRRFFNEWGFPFRGSYITDIFKVKLNAEGKKENVIETLSSTVENAIKKGTIAKGDLAMNYLLLLQELLVLRGGDSAPLVLLPLGDVAFRHTQEFINWVEENYPQYKGAFVRPCKDANETLGEEEKEYIRHYSQRDGSLGKDFWEKGFEIAEREFIRQNQ